MAIPLYLAMTASEFRCQTDFSGPIAWMACHFSPYGTGLTNLPKSLPEGSMLILNDRTPICGHDPGYIRDLLTEQIATLKAASLLLDFQRPDVPETGKLVQILTESLPCPVAVSHHYATELPCPVFVPPVPLTVPAEEYLKPWHGREIWLEAAMDGEMITVTEKGSRFTPLPNCGEDSFPHWDPTLQCHYRIDLEPEQIRFTLKRTEDDFRNLLNSASSLGISHAIGLYQEFFNGTQKPPC